MPVHDTSEDQASPQLSVVLDDPSEYRPEIEPEINQMSLGKDQEQFRQFYQVGCWPYC